MIVKPEDFMSPRTRNTDTIPDAKQTKFKINSKNGMNRTIPSQNLTNLLSDIGTHITSDDNSS